MNKSIMYKLFSILIFIFGLVMFSACQKQTIPTDVYYSTYMTDVTTLKQYDVPDTTGKKIIANVMDGLIENDRFGFYAPSLAESWTHNEDYTIWTFQIREGAYWVDHTGTKYAEVTAQDFVDGLRFVSDPRKTRADVSIIRDIVLGLNEYITNLRNYDAAPSGSREAVEATFDTLVGVKAVSRYVLEYQLAKPTPFFESFLVTEIFLPNHKAFSDAAGIRYGTAQEHLLYNGAYYLEKWQRNKEFVLVKNPHYYDQDKITINQVILQKVSDPAINIEMFKRGQLTSASLAGNQVDFYMNDPKWGPYVNLSDKSTVNYWFFPNFKSRNTEFNAFVHNENFRKALYHGIDRLLLAQLYNPYDAEEMLINTIIPNDVLFDETGKDYTDYLRDIKDLGKNTFNPALARQYFNQAKETLVDAQGNIKGVSAQTIKMGSIAEVNIDGKLPLDLLYVHGTSTDEVQMAMLLKANLEEVFGTQNIHIVLAQYTNDKFGTVIQPGHYDLNYDSFSFKYADPLAQLGRLVTGGEVNDGGFSIPLFDELVQQAANTIRLSERYQLFSQAERLLIEGGYIIPWESGGGTYGMSREIPFTALRGGFGLSRFKYKGIILQSEPVTRTQFQALREAFLIELEERKQGK